MNKFLQLVCALVMMFGTFALSSTPSAAVELDWSGLFRSDYTFIHNYERDSTPNGANFNPALYNAGGYYVPGGGQTNASFDSLFLRLEPKLIVNDNVTIKSELWLGDPVYGFYGNAFPQSIDQRQYDSTYSRGSTISAQRVWAEFLTDFGTVVVGRAPLDFGLGVVWNSGDKMWDRYESTGDMVRLNAKFGAFSFIPSIITYTTGNVLGGAGCQPGASGASTIGTLCNPGQGGAGLHDFSVILKYENTDEDFEGGVNFIKRIANAGVTIDPNTGALGPSITPGQSGTPQGMNYNTWDIYAKKKVGHFTFAIEAPLTSGYIGPSTDGSTALSYSTFAVATETNWHINDTWDLNFKIGHAPGQPNYNGSMDSYKAFYFNENYKIAMIMFNYQLANFAGINGPNTLNNANNNASTQASPYDNPIVNANYLNANGALHADKWTFKASYTYAQAPDGAQDGQNFYNTTRRQVFTDTAGNGNQGTSLGWEMDYGVDFQWDEYLKFGFDFGMYFPGSFFQFANLPGQSLPTSMVYATDVKVGVSF